MDLRWPWLLPVLAGVVLVCLVLWALPWWRARRPGSAVLVAHAERLRKIPRYRVLARRRQAEMLVRTAAVLFLLAGASLLAARETTVRTTQPEVSNRDIMLCLDVSGSMTSYDEQLAREFRRITEDLEGERVGLTLFSGVAVTAFPLTDDYGFVLEQLDVAAENFRTMDYTYIAGTYLGDERASLMSDGLVSCVERFDRPDEERGRAVVLASDNDPQGKPVFSVDEAAEFAAERDVKVYGLGTPEMERRTGDTQEFREMVETTGGQFSIMGEDGSTGQIVDGIHELETARSRKPAETMLLDDPTWGVGLSFAGVLLVLGAGLVRRP